MSRRGRGGGGVYGGRKSKEILIRFDQFADSLFIICGPIIPPSRVPDLSASRNGQETLPLCKLSVDE